MTKEHVITRPVYVLLGTALLNWVTGNGLSPLLPLYAMERGVSVEGTGMVLAAGFVGLAAGSLAAERLVVLVGSRKRSYVVSALLQALAYALMGRATAVWQLVSLLVIAWIGAGMAGALIQVMTGLAVDAERRGRVFGLLALAPPLGALIGASLLGSVATWSGYQWAFNVGSLLVLGAALLMAIGMPADHPHSATSLTSGQHVRAVAKWSVAEVILLLGALLAATTLFFGRLVTPVMMISLHFDAQAIAFAAAIGGLVTLPFVPPIGDLSDRLGRRPVLFATYILIAIASSVLAFADQLWEFSLAAALLSLGFAASGSVTAALAGELIPPPLLPRTLGRLSAINWIAAVIAFAGGGALLGSVATPMLCLIAGLLAVSAGLSLGTLGYSPQPEAVHINSRTDSAPSVRPQG